MQEDEQRVAESEKMREDTLEASKAAADAVAANAPASVDAPMPGGKIIAGLPNKKAASALLAGADPASCVSKSGTVAETNWCLGACLRRDLPQRSSHSGPGHVQAFYGKRPLGWIFDGAGARRVAATSHQIAPPRCASARVSLRRRHRWPACLRMIICVR